MLALSGKQRAIFLWRADSYIETRPIYSTQYGFMHYRLNKREVMLPVVSNLAYRILTFVFENE